MSQIFYEANEIVPIGEAEADFIRAEITGKTQVEADEILAQVKSIMVGLNYRLTNHTCCHLEGLGCIEEVL